MRITKVDIPKSISSEDGLEDIKMSKLGGIVIIAGKNGSGKTRILNKIINALKQKGTEDQSKDVINSDILLNEKSLADVENKIQQLEEILSLGAKSGVENDLKYQLELRDHFKRQIHNLQIENRYTKIYTSEKALKYNAIQFVPKSINLTDCNEISKNQIILNAEKIALAGFDYLTEGVLSKIQLIQNQYYAATHPLEEVSNIDKKTAKDNYNKLKDIIKIFLDADIERDKTGSATIYNFPLGKANLSEGQIILLQYSLAIYSQSDKLSDAILILDEPENHLHPSAIIKIIHRLKKIVTNGQIWISTHSVSLLSSFSPALIWYVENGKIQYAEKIPEKVISSLLGDEEDILMLQDFIGLPERYATIRFAFESLFEPKSVLTGINDPQSKQILGILLPHLDNNSLRILDYGAGKGRMISYIDTKCKENGSNLLDKLDYIAYDEYPQDKEYCNNALESAYGTSENKYFNNYSNLKSVYDKNSFDVILMCNVLHEINPNDWLSLFNKDGMISSLLKSTGILFIAEDLQLPTGEMAYQKGFLVLDTHQIKELFCITEKDNFPEPSIEKNGRLKAHRIPAEYLSRIS